MLGEKNAAAVLAVKDLSAAKKFYEETIGMKPMPGPDPGGQLYKSGESMIYIYPSQFAGSNQATALTWAVGDDFSDIVRGLTEKGVKFEHYDMPGMTLEGDVHKMGDMSGVWFKDPDGNILNVIDRM
jgi:predicted lactoylglutathione lyase